MRWLNLGLRKSPKNLPFFIKLSKNKDVGKFNSTYLIYGIVSNPNITKEQFLDLYHYVSENEQKNLLTRFIDTHFDRNILKWAWDFEKRKQIRGLGKLWVGKKIIKHLDENDELRMEVIEHYKSIRDEVFYNEKLNKEQHIIEYDFFLEFMIENEVSMQSYDEYVQLYSFRMKQINEDISHSFYNCLSRNRELDETRIVNLYNISKNYDEYFRTSIMMNLLQCKNIPENIFIEILNSRKELKNRSLITDLYAGAAKNPTHIHKTFGILFKYLRSAGKNPIESKDLVFRFIVSNPALSRDHVDRIISLLEKWVIGGKVRVDIYGFAQLNHLVWNLFKREDLERDQIKRIYCFYFQYLDTIANYYNNFTNSQKENFSKRIYFKVPKLYLDDDLFGMILHRTSNNVFQHQVLMWLLDSENLTRKQYETILTVIEPMYFKGNTFIGTDILTQNRISAPDHGLMQWASCKYVTNLSTVS